MTAKSERDAQAAGIKYGCFCDIANDEPPEPCVKDFGDVKGCDLSLRHRTREACRYWLPVDAGLDGAK